MNDSRSLVTAEIIVQMDIEGYDYETILSMSPTLLSRTRTRVVEFHYVDLLWSRPFFNQASRAFGKLLGTHTCVHIHPNNGCNFVQLRGLVIPPTAEFTFLRKDRVGNGSYAASFPHLLDFDNTGSPRRRIAGLLVPIVSGEGVVAGGPLLGVTTRRIRTEREGSRSSLPAARRYG